MTKATYRIPMAVAALAGAQLACRPVFAVGGQEIILLIVIVAILLGPFLFRVYRAIENVRKQDRLDHQERNRKK